jgi:FlaA1/EpsC-like NDP-sugar epimerase
MHRFTKWLQKYGHGKRYFAVSTDKAANPTSLMGASKRLMEHVLFAIGSKDLR